MNSYELYSQYRAQLDEAVRYLKAGEGDSFVIETPDRSPLFEVPKTMEFEFAPSLDFPVRGEGDNRPPLLPIGLLRPERVVLKLGWYSSGFIVRLA